MGNQSNNQEASSLGPDVRSGILLKLTGLGFALVLGLLVYRFAIGDFDSIFSGEQSLDNSANYGQLPGFREQNRLAGQINRDSHALDSEPVLASGSLVSALLEPVVETPPLNESDKFVVLEATKLSSGAIVEQIWHTEEVVRKLTHLLASMAEGELSTENFTFLNPLGTLKVEALGENRYLLDQDNFSRYDSLVRAIDALDAETIVNVFMLLRPLLQEAYGELGHSQSEIDLVFRNALQQLGQVPEVGSSIELIRPSVAFKFADPELERLTAVQKQLIRMGPENAEILQNKLSQVVAQLAERSS